MTILDPATPDIPLRGAPAAFLDWETTGVDPLACWPVSVAVVHTEVGESEPRVVFTTKIKPPVPIPPGATEVHLISDDDVADSPTWEEVLPDVEAQLEGRYFGAYNLPYDWQILARLIELTGRQLPPFGAFDPFVLVRAIDKYEKSKKLSVVAERRGITINAHEASSDALVTARLFPSLLRQLARGVRRQKPWGAMALDGPWCEPRHVQTVAGLWEWTRRAAVDQEADFAGYRRSKGQPAPDSPWTDLLGR